MELRQRRLHARGGRSLPPHPIPRQAACRGGQHPSRAHQLQRQGCRAAPCRLEGFDGDMLGKTLRAFGSMQYYDDELLEGESGLVWSGLILV